MFLYVANWKMSFSFNNTLDFCEQNYEGFLRLSQLNSKKVVLCPSFESIAFVSEGFGDSLVEIGAQDCSSSASGTYTGQISAVSLAELGCTYCIVGHSERRGYLTEKSQDVAQKVVRLLENEITPILCVGEKIEDYQAKTVEKALSEQLLPVFKEVKKLQKPRLCIAYEPVWAIGTGKIPEKRHIEDIFEFILVEAKKHALDGQIQLLYGGSVDENSVKSLMSINNLGGFLMGAASLDFKKFEKIVQL